MYPIERFLGVLKDFVKNRNQPEASIAEGNSAKECMIFCSRYLSENGDTRFTRPSRNYEGFLVEANPGELFPITGRPLGAKRNGKGNLIEMDDEVLIQARRYVIINCQDNLPELSAYINEYDQSIIKKRKSRKWTREKSQAQDIVQWLESRVKYDKDASNMIKHIASGPNYIAQSFSGYLINGYRFHTLGHEKNLQTQSSGVTLTAMTSSYASSKDKNPVLANVTYYGAIEEIIQLDYYSHFKVVLFKCRWFDWEKNDYGLIRVNFRRLKYQNDPFVMADQVNQGFYVQDPVQQDWHYFMETLPRDLFDMKVDSSLGEFVSSSAASRVGNLEPTLPIDNTEELQWARDDVEGIFVEIPEETNARATDPEEVYDVEDDHAPNSAEGTAAGDIHSSETAMPDVEEEYTSESETEGDEDETSSETGTIDDFYEYSD
ncbi:unnamed protein product [Linum trigynum]|uniref:DUF4216 domain-containing protein n=1 Tax=Linum trigynum TaxID=586398 RepID=A0AAV2FB79_9ROSI